MNSADNIILSKQSDFYVVTVVQYSPAATAVCCESLEHTCHVKQRVELFLWCSLVIGHTIMPDNGFYLKRWTEKPFIAYFF